MSRPTPLVLALSLLTTLPVGRWLPGRIEARDQGRSVAYYPLVGGCIGVLLYVTASVLQSAPATVAAPVLLLVWVALTGALHLDGLADCVDGWFAGHADSKRTLSVMAEPTAGPMAVVALVLVLLLKTGALVALSAHASCMSALLLTVPIIARSSAAALMATTAYRRPQGIARDQAATRSRRTIALAVGISIVFAGLVLPIALCGLLIVLAGVIVWGWRRLWQQRIGGYTGDIAGALIELVETALLAVATWGLPWG